MLLNNLYGAYGVWLYLIFTGFGFIQRVRCWLYVCRLWFCCIILVLDNFICVFTMYLCELTFALFFSDIYVIWYALQTSSCVHAINMATFIPYINFCFSYCATSFHCTRRYLQDMYMSKLQDRYAGDFRWNM